MDCKESDKGNDITASESLISIVLFLSYLFQPFVSTVCFNISTFVQHQSQSSTVLLSTRNNVFPTQSFLESESANKFEVNRIFNIPLLDGTLEQQRSLCTSLDLL